MGAYGGPDIVEDGLVFAIDPGSQRCYDGTTTINSLVGSNTGTLNNGVTYQSINGGVFDFDGVDQNISIPASSIPAGNQITIDFWNNGDSFASSSIIAASTNTAQDLNIHLPWSNKNIYWDCGSPFNRIQKLATDAEILGWHHWVFTKNATAGTMKIYLDGVLWHSGTSLTSAVPTMIKAFIGSFFNNNIFHNGQIAHCFIYNVSLTAAEVLQNYNALKNRFI